MAEETGLPDGWVSLTALQGVPSQLEQTVKQLVRDLARVVKRGRSLPQVELLRREYLRIKIPPAPETARLRVAASVLCDLVAQGWEVKATTRRVLIRAPENVIGDAMAEKDRVRAGHLIERDRQLRKDSVRQFIKRMEESRLHNGKWTSVFSLMRDGRELAGALQTVAASTGTSEGALGSVVDPFVQVVDGDATCEHTGLRLVDIWRYFRYTWSTAHQSVPGRRMLMLVRDRAAENYPVIGIAALCSPVVQLTVRDKWIGWTPDEFLTWLQTHTTATDARWLLNALKQALKDVYVADFVREKLFKRAELSAPTEQLVAKLRVESVEARKAHERYAHQHNHKTNASNPSKAGWISEAESYLFRSKRSRVLADLLEIKLRFDELGFTDATGTNLKVVLSKGRGRQAISSLLRLIKKKHVGINMLDIYVCGAVPPYTHLLGGKLVSLLTCSPEVVNAYSTRYRNTPSIIASGMCGAPVARKPRLVLLSTTSLYGVASSQYNRLRIPKEALGGTSPSDLEFVPLGKSLGFGSYHLSADTVAEMEVLSRQRREGRRVNRIFGEGVNPKFRMIREALDLSGFPSSEILMHRSPRLVYGVPLAVNFREVLLGRSSRPRYLLDAQLQERGTELIAAFWRRRWLEGRIRNPDVLEKVRAHSLVRPVTHGARVRLASDEDGLPLFRDGRN